MSNTIANPFAPDAKALPSWQDAALRRWYWDRPGWRCGSTELRAWIAETAPPTGTCLEIGPGPGGPTSRFLADHFIAVDGLDVDPDAVANSSLRRFHSYDGTRFPLGDETYDCAVADFVLEHVEHPEVLAAELYRVLRPGGCFYFRTPNLWHYVSLAARLTPHFVHDLVSNRLRHRNADARAVYPTYHRMNTRRRLNRLAARAGFADSALRMIEKEPSYGMASRCLFYPFLAYERIVNASRIFEPFRINVLGRWQR